MYCAWRIPAHLRCTQCSILLHLMDICFLTCICLWQISPIQTFLFSVVRPGLVSTSPAFVSNSASHPAGPHGRHAQKTVNRAPLLGAGSSIQFAQQLEFAVTAPPLVGCVVWSQRDSTAPLFHNLNILNFKKLVTQIIALLMFKYHTGTLPNLISNLFSINSNRHNYYTRQIKDLQINTRRGEMFKNCSVFTV